MATDVQVQCINKSDRPSPHERILNIGGTRIGGVQWKRSQQQAIADIESGTYRYWVKPATTYSMSVIVATTRFGNKYIKTEADGEQPNHLLALPECP